MTSRILAIAYSSNISSKFHLWIDVLSFDRLINKEKTGFNLKDSYESRYSLLKGMLSITILSIEQNAMLTFVIDRAQCQLFGTNKETAPCLQPN